MQFKYYLLLIILLLFLFCKNENTNHQPIQSFPVAKKNIPKNPTISYDYDTTIWTDIGLVDTSINLDLKYATADNFVKEKMYPCGRCFLRPAVATRIIQAQKILQKKDLGLKLFDCYRPKPIQEKLWKKVPNANYVTPPWKLSLIHI